MTRCLLVDTNFSAGPLQASLMAAGHDVLVCGGNPGDALARQATGHVALNYADREALAQCIRAHDIDFLVPGCNDMSYAACSDVNVHFGFPGIDSPDTNRVINDKALFRAACQRLGLPSPAVLTAEQALLQLPVIVKPTDAFSGRGVSIVRTPDGLAPALALAVAQSRQGSAIIETFIEGPLHSHSGFLVNRRIVQDFIVAEHGSCNPFAVDTSHVIHDPDPVLLASLREAVHALADDLGLGDGLIHTQFIRTPDGFRFVEITRRCPGDLYSQLITLSTGYPYVDAYVAPFIGRDIPIAREPLQRQAILRHTITTPQPLHLSHLRFTRPVAIERWVPLCVSGDALDVAPAGRVAVIFLREQDMSGLAQLTDSALARTLYELR